MTESQGPERIDISSIAALSSFNPAMHMPTI
jgi:hypothetical protein